MTKEQVSTEHAPGAVGAYSQAIKANGFVFTAGQVGLDPATGKLVAGGVEAQATQVLKNLEAVLVAAGSSLAHVVKTTVFLNDINDFGAVNGVYGAVFDGANAPKPARSAVQVAALPLGALVEIEAIALLG